VDRTSKLVFVRIYRKATKPAAAILRVLIKTMPYKIQTIFTDNGMQFTDHYLSDGGVWISHIFERVCGQNGIKHRLTKPYHP